MIKKFFSNRARPGWRFDSRLKKYYSWGFDMWLANGHRKRETGFANRADVEATVSRVRQLEKESKYGFVRPVEAPTLEAVCEKKLALTPNKHEHVRAKRVLAGFCRVAEVKKANEVRTEHVQRYVDLRKREGLKPQSIVRELNIISATLRLGVVHFPVLADWTVPRILRPKHSKRRRERVISAQEVVKVLTWLYQPQRKDETPERAANRRNVGHVFQTALLTGARKGELCKLRWSQIDWEARTVQIVGTKTENRSEQTSRPVALDRGLEMILREREGVYPEYVFTRNGGEVTHYYEIMKECCQAVGLAYGKDVAGGFVTHDARHTAVTRMLQAGVDLATIGSITGHGDRTMILRYGHATTESQRRAMQVLENFAGFGLVGDGLETTTEDELFSEGIEQGLVPKGGRVKRKA